MSPPSGKIDPALLEAYYRHSVGMKMLGAMGHGLSPGHLAPAFTHLGQYKEGLVGHRGLTAREQVKDGSKGDRKQGLGGEVPPGGIVHPLAYLPYYLGGMDPSMALHYYHPLYAQVYPQMAQCCNQMSPLVPGFYKPSPVNPAPSPVSSPGDAPRPPSAHSSPQVSPYVFPLPSEGGGEPLDQLPRSLYTSKTHKGHLCIYCGKLYSRKYGLKIHLRTHTGYKPLKCKVCQRPFGDPSNLNKHIRLHAEGDTPYRCLYCGKVLVRRRDLERHIKSRHPNATDNDTIEVTSTLSSPEHVTGSDSPCLATGSDVMDSVGDCHSDSVSDYDENEDIEVV